MKNPKRLSSYEKLERQQTNKSKKALKAYKEKAMSLAPPGGRWTQIFDYNTGYWQQDVAIELDSVLTFGAVFACIRLIATDIGKMRIKLVQQDSNDIWRETESNAFSPVLRKPNPVQTRIKFVEHWIQSKLQFGNTYVLKSRDNRGVVKSMLVLDPTRVQTLISDSGEVFYRLRMDNLAKVPSAEITVPATEIIHDVHMTPEHPLVGVSPIGACGLAATQGLKIQQNSTKQFTNMSRPAGILTAPGAISDPTAARLKASWEANYGGDNFGKTAVLGDGLEYKPVAVNAVDSQLIEQLRWTSEDVCRAFGVPAYKIGVGPMPAFNNVESLERSYYSQCLQELIECVEILLDEGLELPNRYGCEFDLTQLLRMDTASRYAAHGEAIKAGWKAPNEVRKDEDLPPVEGGDEPWLQQQNWPLSILANRAPPDTQAPAQQDDEQQLADEAEIAVATVSDGLKNTDPFDRYAKVA